METWDLRPSSGDCPTKVAVQESSIAAYSQVKLSEVSCHIGTVETYPCPVISVVTFITKCHNCKSTKARTVRDSSFLVGQTRVLSNTSFPHIEKVSPSPFHFFQEVDLGSKVWVFRTRDMHDTVDCHGIKVRHSMTLCEFRGPDGLDESIDIYIIQESWTLWGTFLSLWQGGTCWGRRMLGHPIRWFQTVTVSDHIYSKLYVLLQYSTVGHWSCVSYQKLVHIRKLCPYPKRRLLSYTLPFARHHFVTFVYGPRFCPNFS